MQISFNLPPGKMPRHGGDAANGLVGPADFSGQAFRDLLDGPAGRQGENLTGTALLSEALAALDAGIDVDGSAGKLEVKVEIGEDAVAFQAQPMLAQTAAAVGTLGGPSAAPQSRAEPLNPPAITQPPIEAGGPQSAAPRYTHPQSPGGILRADMVPGLEAPQRAAPPIAPSRALSASSAKTVPATHFAPSPALQRSEAKAQRGPGIEPGAQRSAFTDTTGNQARASLFAQLVAAASEYRVQIRGVRIQDLETQQLAENIRAALRSLGMPDRPVVFETNHREP